jgi:hypothetical protein
LQASISISGVLSVQYDSSGLSSDTVSFDYVLNMYEYFSRIPNSSFVAQLLLYSKAILEDGKIITPLEEAINTQQ